MNLGNIPWNTAILGNPVILGTREPKVLLDDITNEKFVFFSSDIPFLVPHQPTDSGAERGIENLSPRGATIIEVRA